MKKIGVISVVFTVFLLTGCGGPDYKKIEKDFIAVASKNYEEDIRGKVLVKGGSQVITLESLEKAKVDITEFTNANCDKTSYLKITENELDEEGMPVGDYKTEVFLTCGSYKSQSLKK